MADNSYSSYDALRQPFSTEAEQAVLGALLLDFEVMSDVIEILPDSKYFYVQLHKDIYSVMITMFANGRVCDYVTVLDELIRSGNFDEGSGKVYLKNLFEACTAPSNAPAHAKIVKEKFEMRQLILASKKTMDEALSEEDDPSLILDAAEQRIYDIRQSKNRDSLEHIGEVLLGTFERLDLLNKNDPNTKPIPTGISDLDRTMTGLNRSDLILLAARPGMGKTSFALNIAKNVALNSKKNVAFFSLEMTKEQLASRLLSMQALVSGTTIRTGKLTDEEWQRLISAGDVLTHAPIWLDDTPGITIPEMKAKVRRRKNIDVVFIDYLQLMSSPNRRNDSRVQEISEITRNLKILAKELSIPVICLSQLSRKSEERQDHRPMLSDLRESGSIEQDSDIVMFLYREGYYKKDGDEDDMNAVSVDQDSAECIIAKNRHGATTSVKLHWKGEFMLFTAEDRNREE